MGFSLYHVAIKRETSDRFSSLNSLQDRLGESYLFPSSSPLPSSSLTPPTSHFLSSDHMLWSSAPDRPLPQLWVSLEAFRLRVASRRLVSLISFLRPSRHQLLLDFGSRRIHCCIRPRKCYRYCIGDSLGLRFEHRCRMGVSSCSMGVACFLSLFRVAAHPFPFSLADWVRASTSGSFTSPLMIPGVSSSLLSASRRVLLTDPHPPLLPLIRPTLKLSTRYRLSYQLPSMTRYLTESLHLARSQMELAVATSTVTVTAGGSVTANIASAESVSHLGSPDFNRRSSLTLSLLPDPNRHLENRRDRRNSSRLPQRRQDRNDAPLRPENVILGSSHFHRRKHSFSSPLLRAR